ncbi:LexA-binding, inner membrane-associated putative hydrolase [Haladaptatus litoreus]|uniref:LexA-binding, inner membrane-associated putative hydrolase n=1 Tax=Haladaptatus litoreus TaxID=553468 RepID=A0A1N7DLU4_9EURY|nr:metal-dependent hydrolase [Haladaptatus litoreus]SIR76804.1 LexA-binding, inner membrane-associated putative hydrolase [Haladaptatus litoreus]
MWPWGHLAAGYLLYSGYCSIQLQNRPTAIPVFVLALGTQFPDIIDKPLAWTFGILPTGRSLTHSLFFAALLLGCLYYFSQKTNHRDIWLAFTIGYLSHLLADAALPLLEGETAYANFLLWPVLSTPSYETTPSFVAHFTSIEFTGFFAFQLLLVVVAIVFWIRDGLPGLQLWQKISHIHQSRN